MDPFYAFALLFYVSLVEYVKGNNVKGKKIVPSDIRLCCCILPQEKRYENVIINCIDGNGMRGIPLRCPYSIL